MQPKNKSSYRPKYDRTGGPATFKADVLKMIANGQSAAYVAQALGISEALIYKWKHRTKGEEKYHSSSQALDMIIENQRLLQRSNQLETDRTAEAARNLKNSPPGGPVGHLQPTDLRVRYELVKELACAFTVESLCSVLAVGRPAYYRYVRGDSHQLTSEKTAYQQLVEQTFTNHKRRYGTGLAYPSTHKSGVAGKRSFRRATSSSNVDEKGWFADYAAAAADRLNHLYHQRRIVPTVEATAGPPVGPNLLLDQPLPRAPNLVWQGRLLGL